MQDKIRSILDSARLSTERLNAYNDIIEHDIADKIEGKGLNDVITILRAMITASYREVKEIDIMLDELYKIASELKESEMMQNE